MKVTAGAAAAVEVVELQTLLADERARNAALEAELEMLKGSFASAGSEVPMADES